MDVSLLWGASVCYQLDLWLIELQDRFELTSYEILAISGLSKATYYRIMAKKPVSEKTRRQILLVYLQLLAEETSGFL